jgi:hypothetical protein
MQTSKLLTLLRSQYKTSGRDFDGTNDYATRGANLTGIADGKAGLLSLWLRVDDAGANNFIFGDNTSSATSKLHVVRFTSGQLQINGRNAAAATILTVATAASAVGASAAWRHVLASWNLATGAGQLYIDDANAKSGAGTQTDDTINHAAATNFSVGGGTAGGTKLNGCLSEIWFNTEYLDISVEANRRKFISAARRPVNLGASGLKPTGNQPLIYMPAGDPTDNRGAGGNFSVTGALDLASTSPSDR